MEPEIIEISYRPELLDKAVEFIWKCWGDDTNFKFYKDCITHSLEKDKILPKFYLALENEDIIGSYSLLTNDLISRQDLMPWFACLYVTDHYRNKGIATRLLNHGLKEAKRKGFRTLYLSTDLVDFYEKNGWKHLCNGYNVFNKELKIYYKDTL